MSDYRILRDRRGIYVQRRLFWNFWTNHKESAEDGNRYTRLFESEYKARTFVEDRKATERRVDGLPRTVLYDTRAPTEFAKIVRPVNKKEEQ